MKRLTNRDSGMRQPLVYSLPTPGLHLETGLDDVGRSRQIRRWHATIKCQVNYQLHKF